MRLLKSASMAEKERNILEHLCQNYRHSMFHTAFTILQEESLAEDAVCRAFVKLFPLLRKINIRDSQKVRGLTSIVTKHTAFSSYKELAAASSKQNNDGLDLLMLVYLHRLKLKEAAKIVGISRFSAWKLLRAAKKELENSRDNENKSL